MTVQLPVIVAAYFHAEKSGNADALLRCFTPDATVTDEGQKHSGLAEIRQWLQSVREKYSVTLSPTAVFAETDGSVVTTKVAGNFPGSPIDLKFHFAHDDKAIAALKIAP